MTEYKNINIMVIKLLTQNKLMSLLDIKHHQRTYNLCPHFNGSFTPTQLLENGSS